jgi:hypothetical protein
VIDPEVERVRWDEDSLTFEATRWSLHEISLVNVPADILSGVRSMTSSGLDRAAFIGAPGDVLVRAQARQRMHERQNAHDQRLADQPANVWRRGSPSKVFP